VDLLVKKADGRVLNQPTLWTKDNEEAVFIKGQKVAFIESDQTDRTNLNAVNRTFTYEDVGVTLRVRPNITPEKAVDMTINLNISQVEKDLINTQVARKNLDTTTHLIVNDGQTILMGGILFQNDEKLVQKIPLLGDIPVLGVLFSHTGTTLSNSELLVFVTPYVVDERALSGMPVKSEQQRREAIKGPGERMESALENLSGRMSARWADPNNL
jgi:general secretion pathway protein D